MPKPTRLPDQRQQQLLSEVRVQVAQRRQLPRLHKLLDQHHYLGSLKPVGKRIVTTSPRMLPAGGWPSWCSAPRPTICELATNGSAGPTNSGADGVNPDRLNEQLLAIQQLLRGPAPGQELVVMEGKESKHGSGASVLTAVTVPS